MAVMGCVMKATRVIPLELIGVLSSMMQGVKGEFLKLMSRRVGGGHVLMAMYSWKTCMRIMTMMKWRLFVANTTKIRDTLKWESKLQILSF